MSSQHQNIFYDINVSETYRKIDCWSSLVTETAATYTGWVERVKAPREISTTWSTLVNNSIQKIH